MKKRNGFTLIELLAVIVIIAIIVFITTPLIINTIKSAKKGAFLDSSYAIVNAAEQGYAKGLIKETDLEPTKYTFNNGIQTLMSGNVEVNFKGSNPEYGIIIINDEGKVAINLYSGGFCSTKEYDTDVVTVREVDNKDDCVIDIIPPVITLNGGDIVLTANETSYIDSGYIALDGQGNDITSDIIITNNIVYGTKGEYKITYKVTDANKNTTTTYRKVTVVENEVILRAPVSGDQTSVFLYGPIKKYTIESIKFIVASEVPSEVLGSWDVSANRDKSIMAWYTDKDGNGLYEVTIGSDNKIMANATSSYLFQYLTKATTIEFDNFDTSNVTTMYSMFSFCDDLTSLDVSSFNTSNVTDMRSMFYYMEHLLALDVSNFNTSKITDMYLMFSHMGSLTSLDVSNFDTSNVTNMSSMFYSVRSLPTLDLSNFDTSNVTNMGSMFREMASLTSLDVSNFNTSKVTDMGGMFMNMSNLTSLDLSNFNTSNVTKMGSMFAYSGKLISLDLRNFASFSSVTQFDYMFSGIKGITIYTRGTYNQSWLYARLNASLASGTVIMV
ncbi:MAG: BspA family leucine-rich repeat surface protein [Bacilli bacterium]|nr:BspA family leucine-rich repeat surface protein [Bacilli bacterium]